MVSSFFVLGERIWSDFSFTILSLASSFCRQRYISSVNLEFNVGELISSPFLVRMSMIRSIDTLNSVAACPNRGFFTFSSGMFVNLVKNLVIVLIRGITWPILL